MVQVEVVRSSQSSLYFGGRVMTSGCIGRGCETRIGGCCRFWDGAAGNRGEEDGGRSGLDTCALLVGM